MTPTPEATGNVSLTPATASSDAFSNEVALAALVLGGGAFVIAFLQMVYQYLTSNLRDKCSSGAIGGWQKYMSTGWDVLNWRPRIEYPQIQLNPWYFLNERHLAEVAVAEELSHFEDLISQSLAVDRYRWIDPTTRNESPRVWDVWYPGHALVTPGFGYVSVFQLPFRAKLLWLRFLWKHPRPDQSIVRASWANMFTCLGIAPSKSLVIRKQRADVIPSAMDAPLQNTDLSTVLQWCYLLGLKNIHIDWTEATISTESIYANITTTNLKVPGLAKVISLDGDLDNLRNRVSWATSGELRNVIEMARGRLFYVTLHIDCDNYKPSHVLYALQNGWTYQRPPKERQVPGDLYQEAAACAPPLPGERRVLSYRYEHGRHSLLQTLAFLLYQNICSAFPIKSILLPYKDLLRRKITDWWKVEGCNLCCILPLQKALFSIRRHSLFTASSQFLLTEPGVVTGFFGSRSWIFFSSHNALKAWDDDCFQQITNLNESGDFVSRFPLLNDVQSLLKGRTVEDIRSEYIAGVLDLSKRFTIRIEPALWLSLFSVEGRIEALWDEILKVGGDVSKPKISCCDVSSPRGARGVLNSAAEFWTPNVTAEHKHKPLEPSLAGFLALWLDVFDHHRDLFSSDFNRSFEEVLCSWKEKEEKEKLCVPEPAADDFVDALPPDNPVAPPWTKGEFYQWVDQGTRMQLLPKMVPWLRLRSALLYHFLLCNEDSSRLRDAQAAQIQVRVA